ARTHALVSRPPSVGRPPSSVGGARRPTQTGPGGRGASMPPKNFPPTVAPPPYRPLVHEMVHVWQEQYGHPASRGYHNKQWAAKMKAVGLQPSGTIRKLPGGAAN